MPKSAKTTWIQKELCYKSTKLQFQSILTLRIMMLSKRYEVDHTMITMCLKEQDKSSDIEQQPPFGDRKISNIQPQNRGGGT